MILIYISLLLQINFVKNAQFVDPIAKKPDNWQIDTQVITISNQTINNMDFLCIFSKTGNFNKYALGIAF